MKRNRAVRLIALLSMLVCLVASASAQAAASGTQPQAPVAATAVNGPVDTGAGGPPFSKADLMALAAGATCLVALGIGFRRVSAPLE
jgi:opacity protein-like surface antigen